MKTLVQCEVDGAQGWKCREDGTCFTGVMAKQNAFAEDAKRKAEEWAKKPKESTVEFLEQIEKAREAAKKKSTKN